MEQNLTFPSAQVGRARIKAAFAQVEIVTGEGDFHQLIIAGDDESLKELRAELSGDEIVVVQPQLSYAKEVLQKSRWLQICLRLAKGFSGSVDVDTSTGPVGVHKITCDDLSLSTITGLIRARGAQAKSLHLHTVSGTIAGDTIRADRVQLRSVSGDISLESLTFETAKSFTVSGAVNLSLLPGGHTLDMYSVSGSAGIAVEGPAKATFGSLVGQFILGDEVKEGPGCLEISASSMSGSLAVRGWSARDVAP